MKQLLKEAAEMSGQAVRIAESGEQIDLALACHELEDHLAELWAVRRLREDDWVDVLNVLQSMLAKETFEDWTVEQCRAIDSVISEVLCLGYVDLAAHRKALRTLRAGGFNPWRGVAGEVEIPDEK